MRSFHRRESSYQIEVNLKAQWMEFHLLSQPAKDHINSLRLLPVEETQELLEKVFNGTLII